MAKHSPSYYPKAFLRKFAAQINQLGIIDRSKQQAFLNLLIESNQLTVTVSYSPEYHAFQFLDQFETQLTFEKGIAISEKTGNRNPLTPCVYALSCYNQYCEDGSEKALEAFNLHLDYIESLRKRSGNDSYWEYESDLKRFELKAPWVSGITQGLMSSLYFRKYKESGGVEYLDVAKGAISFALDSNNGLYRALSEGHFWIEEYPAEKGAGVLNGFIFFILALGELAAHNIYVSEYTIALKSLLAELPNYHVGKYIKYGKNIPDLGNENYQEIHYYQLEHLYHQSSAKIFNELKNYWLMISGLPKSTDT